MKSSLIFAKPSWIKGRYFSWICWTRHQLVGSSDKQNCLWIIQKFLEILFHVMIFLKHRHINCVLYSGQLYALNESNSNTVGRIFHNFSYPVIDPYFIKKTLSPWDASCWSMGNTETFSMNCQSQSFSHTLPSLSSHLFILNAQVNQPAEKILLLSWKTKSYRR